MRPPAYTGAMMLALIAMALGAYQSDDILIYASDGTYLGCLTCAAADRDSVWNRYSPQGWENPTGLWSEHGDYRSRYSERSACNPSAAKPPTVRERSGRPRGALTISPYHRNGVCASGGEKAICERLTAMCGG